MKICKDTTGFYLLDEANSLVYLRNMQTHFSSPAELALSYWVKNDRHTKVANPEVLIKDITSFKALKYKVLEYYANKEIK